MHLVVGEVAPLAPLLIPLGEILVWAIALAVCLLAVYFAKAFFGLAGGVLGKLPIVGGWIDSGLTSVEHKIVATMSGAAAASDAKMGAALHQLARVIDWIGHEIAAHANLINTLATLLLGQNVAALLAQANRLFNTRVRAVESSATAALHRISIAEKRLAHGIGADVLPRLRSLDRELEHVIARDIPGIRAREADLTRGAESLRTWVHRHILTAGSVAFAGATAFALARLGLGWLRCNSLGRIGRQIGCGGFKILEDVLFGVIDVLVIADLCQITRLMIDAAESAPVQDGLRLLVGGIDDLLLCQNVSRPPAWSVSAAALPPAQVYSALPAV